MGEDISTAESIVDDASASQVIQDMSGVNGDVPADDSNAPVDSTGKYRNVRPLEKYDGAPSDRYSQTYEQMVAGLYSVPSWVASEKEDAASRANAEIRNEAKFHLIVRDESDGWITGVLKALGRFLILGTGYDNAVTKDGMTMITPYVDELSREVKQKKLLRRMTNGNVRSVSRMLAMGMDPDPSRLSAASTEISGDARQYRDSPEASPCCMIITSSVRFLQRRR